MSNSSNPLLPPLPLIHEDDTYILYLSEVSQKTLRLEGILFYPGNTNVEPTAVSFRDLDKKAKDACIAQVNRRHVGKSVLV